LYVGATFPHTLETFTIYMPKLKKLLIHLYYSLNTPAAQKGAFKWTWLERVNNESLKEYEHDT
jgi:hypothetical protein